MNNNKSYQNIMSSLSNYDIESKGNRIYLPRMNTVIPEINDEPIRAVPPPQPQPPQTRQPINNYTLRRYDDKIRSITQDFIESRSFTNLLLMMMLFILIFVTVVVVSRL